MCVRACVCACVCVRARFVFCFLHGHLTAIRCKHPVCLSTASDCCPSCRHSPFYVTRCWPGSGPTSTSWAACCCTSATWRGPTSGRQTTSSQDSAPDVDVPASATAATKTPNLSEFIGFRSKGRGREKEGDGGSSANCPPAPPPHLSTTPWTQGHTT